MVEVSSGMGNLNSVCEPGGSCLFNAGAYQGHGVLPNTPAMAMVGLGAVAVDAYPTHGD